MLSFANFLKKISPSFGIPAAILIAIFFNPDLAQMSFDHFYFPIGTLLILLGLYLRIWVRGYVRNEGFVVDGPYRYVRNPVELGTILIYLGVSIALGLNWWQQLILVASSFLYFETISISNEDEMRRSLGNRYERYRNRVRRWLPSRHPGMNRSGVSFSVTRGILRERDFLLFLLVLVICLSVKRSLGIQI
jgi:protein-S-isoprenylcysteine O-methyltransferase Ste14